MWKLTFVVIRRFSKITNVEQQQRLDVSWGFSIVTIKES